MERQLSKEKIKEIQSKYDENFKKLRLSLITEGDNSYLIEALSTFKIKDIVNNIEKSDYVSNPYYIFVYDIFFEIKSKDGKIIESTLTTANSESLGGDEEWKIEGYFNYFDGYEGEGEIDGENISDFFERELYIKVSEETIYTILNKIGLSPLLDQTFIELEKQQDKEIVDFIKMKFGDQVEKVIKNNYRWQITFSNGITIISDYMTLLSEKDKVKFY